MDVLASLSSYSVVLGVCPDDIFLLLELNGMLRGDLDNSYYCFEDDDEGQ